MEPGAFQSGLSASPDQSVTIQQLGARNLTLKTSIGQQSPPAGLYSPAYGISEPNYQVSYTAVGKSAVYTTLITAGLRDTRFSVAFDEGTNQVVVHDHGRVTTISLGRSKGRSESVAKATDPHAPSYKTIAIAGTEPWRLWKGTGAGSVSIEKASDTGTLPSLRLLPISTARSPRTDGARRPFQVQPAD